MRKTGVFVDSKQKAELMKLVQIAQTTPVIALSSADALSGNDLSSQAWKAVHDRLNEIALKCGLPELVETDYGLDADGEIVTV